MDISLIHPCLVRPAGSANIGAAVRAAKSMGLGAVRLVQPHAELDGETRKMAAGAIEDLAEVVSYPGLDAALADAVRVYGLSARQREHRGEPLWLEKAAEEALAATRNGKVVFLFGTERTGLENEELDRAHALVRIPTSPEFKSLNVAMAVMVTAYELRKKLGAELEPYEYELATARDLENCVNAMAEALDKRDFFVSTKRALALRRIRDLLGRSLPKQNEIALLRGIIRSLDEDPVIGLDREPES